MNPERLLLVALLGVALLVGGCPAEDEEKDPGAEPIDVTVSVAIGEPDTPTNEAIEPDVAYDGTRIHLVYCQDDGAAQHDLMYTQRLGGGAFTTPAPVFPSSVEDSRAPHVCLEDNGTLHMVWVEGTSPNREIYYATRNSSGTISTPANLSSTVGEDEANPRVLVDSTGRIHVVWEGSTPPPNPTTAIFYRRTQGSVFLASTILPKANGNQPAEMPDLTADIGDRIYVVWAESDGVSRNIRMVRSDDNGANFGGVGSGFAATGSVDMTQPRVEGGLDGEVFLAFIGQDSGGDRGLFTTFTRTGGTFAGPGQLITSDTGGLRDPELAKFKRDDDNYTLLLVCNDGSAGGGEILGFASHDNATNWPGDPINFSQGNSQPASNRMPAVALDDNEIIVTWHAEPQGGGVVRTWTSTNDYSLP